MCNVLIMLMELGRNENVEGNDGRERILSHRLRIVEWFNESIMVLFG